MKKEIRIVDEKRGILQVTTPDERWYPKRSINAKTGLPEYEFVPSVTWITHFYPKGIELQRWIASKGWDESQAIKQEAGAKGTKVHHAIKSLLEGETIDIRTTKFENTATGIMEELTPDELDGVIAFMAWHEEVKPEAVGIEFVVWTKEYAGTVDFLCKSGEDYWLIDFKTGQSVWPEYELQVSAYKHALLEERDGTVSAYDSARLRLAILQIGYKRNKSGWKFTEVADQFELFKATQQIWAKETKGQKPLQKDYPLVLSLIPATEEAEAVAAEQTINA